MVGSREFKMVALLATALALGVGAVAACVIPWFYCKPPDADDDNREATGIRDGSDPGSHFQSAVDENLNPATNIRINGISYVRVVVPPNTSSNQSTIPTSTMMDTATLNAFCLEDPVNKELRHPVPPHNLEVGFQSSGNADPMTSGQTNSGIIKDLSRNPKSAMKINTSKVSVSKSEASQPSESDIENSDVSHSGFINPKIVGVRVLIKNEENAPVKLPGSESSNPTDESRPESTIRTSSASSELLNPDSIRSLDAVTESKQTLSLITGSTDPESSALTSSTRTEERSSTTLTTSDPSNPTDESSTGTSNRTSTSQESVNSSSGPTKVLIIADVESSKISDVLETIQEVSTSPAESPPPKIPRQSDYRPARFNTTPYPWVGNEESITSTSTRASNRKPLHANQTPSIPGTPVLAQSASNRQDAEIKKTSRGFRYVEALSGRMKKIWRGIKSDTTPRSGRSKYAQQTESMKSLSAGKKCPTGHSTLISEDQHLLDTIRTRRSPIVLHSCLLKTFEDPGIPINDNPNCVSHFGIEGDEEPLDLSIRSSQEQENAQATEMSAGKKILNRSADSCKEAFREVAECLKVRRSSKSNKDVIGVSESLIFSRDTSKICLKDENQNVRSVFPQVGNIKVGDNANYSTNTEEKLDRSCLPKSNRFPRSIKKIFRIGSKDRSKRHKLLPTMQQEQVSNSAPVKCLENPTSTSSHLKSELNVKVIRTPDSCTDISSYFELGVAKTDDVKYPDEPCTEL